MLVKRAWWTLDRAGGDLCFVGKTLNSHSASPPPYFTLCNPHPDHSLVSAFGSERIKTIQNRFFEFKRHLYFFISFHLTLTCTLSYLMISYLFSCQSNFIMASLLRFVSFVWISRSRNRKKRNQQNVHDVKSTPRHILVFSWSSFFKIHIVFMCQSIRYQYARNMVWYVFFFFIFFLWFYSKSNIQLSNILVYSIRHTA